MTLVFAAIAQLAFVLFPQAVADEDVLRGLVQQYYDAQTKKDADKAAAFWSTFVNPRMSRESYLAVFGAGDAEYTPEIQSLTIKGVVVGEAWRAATVSARQKAGAAPAGWAGLRLIGGDRH